MLGFECLGCGFGRGAVVVVCGRVAVATGFEAVRECVRQFEGLAGRMVSGVWLIFSKMFRRDEMR